MAYTELTCDDDGLSLETLYRMSMIDNGDGTYSQRVIDASASLPFVCLGAGYGSFTVGDNGTIISAVYQDGVDGNGYPLYFKVGGNPATDKIYWTGQWVVEDAIMPGDWLYIELGGDIDFPYLDSIWIAINGVEPTPTFTLP